MSRPNAQQTIKEKYPHAYVVRSLFGLVVVIDRESQQKLGDGRAWWEEEAWISAVESADRGGIL